MCFVWARMEVHSSRGSYGGPRGRTESVNSLVSSVAALLRGQGPELGPWRAMEPNQAGVALRWRAKLSMIWLGPGLSRPTSAPRRR